MNRRTIDLELSTWVDGRQWHLYSFEFKTPDGTFGSYFYAISDEHAAELLTDLKENAVLGGRIMEAGKV
ncbi:TPA: hypothetical protein ACHY14_000794 [Pseudomonas aeruginosa]|uniref:hypothetical protein n=1 Tax=Pseudomonas aeruginosa TaxID=287 RepID=UPI0029C0B0FF|nr:hypothetical protein [Pseudomonas aeruginosa]HEJ9974926.1 hypothetical protein [Pseudomonas aeruginosa]HEJ9985965.1 hypothetical protein [Pseudomonas aeruginosa]